MNFLPVLAHPNHISSAQTQSPLMKPVYLLLAALIGCIAPSVVQAQGCIPIATHPRLHRFYQFSSIGARNGVFYLFSEKCDSLFVVKVRNDSLVPITGIHLPSKPQRPYSIEGAAAYKNTFLIADEGEWRNGRPNPVAQLWQYDIAQNQFRTVRVDSIPNFTSFVANCGIEGIAVSADGARCYLLRERDGCGTGNGPRHAWLYTLRIDSGAAGLTLTALGNPLEIPLPSSDSRYSELVLQGNRLLMLYSHRGTEYAVHAIQLKDGFPVNEITQVTSGEFSSYVRGLGNAVNNVEGMAILGNRLYVISDNDAGNCKSTSKVMLAPASFCIENF